MNAVADETRIAESPTVAAVTWTSVPTWMPSDRGEAGRAPLVDAPRDDVEDGGPGHGENRERREREDRECLRLDDHAFSSQTSRSPSSVRCGSTTEIVLECGATSSASPPVATTWASTPSSPRIAVTIPSTWPAKP